MRVETIDFTVTHVGEAFLVSMDPVCFPTHRR
jgi:hypothetical protein